MRRPIDSTALFDVDARHQTPARHLPLCLSEFTHSLMSVNGRVCVFTPTRARRFVCQEKGVEAGSALLVPLSSADQIPTWQLVRGRGELASTVQVKKKAVRKHIRRELHPF